MTVAFYGPTSVMDPLWTHVSTDITRDEAADSATIPIQSAYPRMETDPGDWTGKFFRFKAVSIATSAASSEMGFHARVGDSDLYGIIFSGTSVRFRRRQASVNYETTLTYDPAIHVYFEFGFDPDTGEAVWRTSPDNIDWSNEVRREAAGVSPTSLHVRMYAGTWSTSTGDFVWAEPNQAGQAATPFRALIAGVEREATCQGVWVGGVLRSVVRWERYTTPTEGGGDGGGDIGSVVWSEDFSNGLTYDVHSNSPANATYPTDTTFSDPSGRMMRVRFNPADTDSNGEFAFGYKYRLLFSTLGLAEADELYMTEDQFYPSDLDLETDTTKMVPGLAGKTDDLGAWDLGSGGQKPPGTWSTRLTTFPTNWWRSDDSGPGLCAYLYVEYAAGETRESSTGGYGIEVVVKDPDTGAQWLVPRNKVVRYTHRVVLNTPGVRDGIYELWITVDGVRKKYLTLTDVEYNGDYHVPINGIIGDYFFNQAGTNVDSHVLVGNKMIHTSLD